MENRKISQLYKHPLYPMAGTNYAVKLVDLLQLLQLLQPVRVRVRAALTTQFSCLLRTSSWETINIFIYPQDRAPHCMLQNFDHRAAQACIACRKRKVKCSSRQGEHERCRQCTHNGLRCEYAPLSRQKRTGTHRGAVLSTCSPAAQLHQSAQVLPRHSPDPTSSGY